MYDLLGDVATAERTVLRYLPLTFRLVSPRPNSVVSGRPRIQLQCIGAAPYECEYACAEIRSQTRSVGSACGARREGAPAGPLQFSVYPSSDVQPGEVLSISVSSGLAGLGREFRDTVGPLYVESSPKLTAVYTAPGVILDFDATRILFIDRYQQLGVLDRATQAITWIATLPPDPAGRVPTYGHRRVHAGPVSDGDRAYRPLRGLSLSPFHSRIPSSADVVPAWALC
ncbi:hypothetical protein BE17_38260 [Sorangium cellulosum]|uniref:Uncharacterized protein n=1 Tax=Sorangium cellulosum TaxID=56 RepID=A0A150RN49_SORCE|nr:hypothetical protein BE17_38260 [Sorangium cellulosum]